MLERIELRCFTPTCDIIRVFKIDEIPKVFELVKAYADKYPGETFQVVKVTETILAAAYVEKDKENDQ